MAPSVIAPAMLAASYIGGVIVRRVYSNVTAIAAKWKPLLTELGYELLHQPSVIAGKNAADIALASDALELFYRQHITTFVLVASDSDDTPLVLRLHAYG